MPLFYSKTYTLAALDADGICESQTTAAAGALLLNGALVSSGIYTTSDSCAKRISVYSASNISTINFIITGTLYAGGPSYSETVTGVNNSTVSTIEHFHTVEDVEVDVKLTSAAQVGTLDSAVTPPRYLTNRSRNGIGVSLSISGTATVTVQHTLADILYLKNNTRTYTNTLGSWLNNDAATTPLVDLTSGETAAGYNVPVVALRAKITAYSSMPSITLKTTENVG